ncbi:MAG: Hsp20/alpha crystallin family protein [Gammaproteobacteria bacterium]
MSLLHYDPLNAFRHLNRDFDRFSRFVGEPAVEGGNWMPAVDIREDGASYALAVDVPGVNPNDIEVTLEDGVLTIKGERKREYDEKGNGYTRTERVHGSFVRRFSLPETVNADAVTAKGKDGVLTIVIPKQAKVEPRRITVS